MGAENASFWDDTFITLMISSSAFANKSLIMRYQCRIVGLYLTQDFCHSSQFGRAVTNPMSQPGLGTIQFYIVLGEKIKTIFNGWFHKLHKRSNPVFFEGPSPPHKRDSEFGYTQTHILLHILLILLNDAERENDQKLQQGFTP
jgi:hypothetical protein